MQSVSSALGEILKEVKSELGGRIDATVGQSAADSRKSLELVSEQSRQATELLKSMAFAAAHRENPDLTAAERVSKQTIDGIDPLWLSLATPHRIPETAGVGLTLVMAAAQGVCPFAEAKRAKRYVKDRFAKVQGHLDNASKVGELWSGVAESLAAGTPPPQSADHVLRAAVATIQGAAKLGQGNAKDLADEIQRHALRILSDTAEAARIAQVRLFAARNATANQASKYWARCAKGAQSEAAAKLYATIAGTQKMKGKVRARSYHDLAPSRNRSRGNQVKRPPPSFSEVVQKHVQNCRKLGIIYQEPAQ
jgi:hypothetical protein